MFRRFAFPSVSYKWNHTVRTLLNLLSQFSESVISDTIFFSFRGSFQPLLFSSYFPLCYTFFKYLNIFILANSKSFCAISVVITMSVSVDWFFFPLQIMFFCFSTCLVILIWVLRNVNFKLFSSLDFVFFCFKWMSNLVLEGSSLAWRSVRSFQHLSLASF